MKKVATLCRASISECDLPEYCDGLSEFCPSNTYRQNGGPCGKEKVKFIDDI